MFSYVPFIKSELLPQISNETGLPLIPDYAVQTLSPEEMQEMSVVSAHFEFH